MKIEEKITQLSVALATIDSLLVYADHYSEVKVYSELYSKVNSVYVALCHERIFSKEIEKRSLTP